MNASFILTFMVVGVILYFVIPIEPRTPAADDSTGEGAGQ